MSQAVNFFRFVIALMFLFLAPVALAGNIQGDTPLGPKVLAQATPQPGQEEPAVDDDTKGSDVEVNVETGEDTTGARDNEMVETQAVTDTEAFTATVDTDVTGDTDNLTITAGQTETVTGTGTFTAGVSTTDPQAGTGEEEVLLPETGGVATPWTSLLLLAAGTIFVLGGLAGLAFIRRSR